MLKFRPNRKYTQIAVYVIGTIIAIYLIITVGNNMPSIIKFLSHLKKYLSDVFTPLLVGFVIAYLLKPLVKKVEASVQKISFLENRKKQSHLLSVAIVSLFVLLFFTLIKSLVRRI